MIVPCGRTTVAPNVRDWLKRAVAAERTHVVPISVAVAATGAELLGKHGGDPADWIIVETAQAERASLVKKVMGIHRGREVQTAWVLRRPGVRSWRL